MPNSFTRTGLTTATQAELQAQYQTALKAIYGASINLGAETPDGQWLNIIIQSILDLEDLLTQIYSSFDPDNAIGTVLDQRAAINGIRRQAGTYTVTPITLTTTQSVNLYGLDQSENTVFTVADAAGNQYQLQTTQLGFSAPAGTALQFQASVPGAITPTPNTITIPVTIVLGVSAINNPTSAGTIGVTEETDAQFKLRRAISVALPSQGYYNGLLAALENIPGVSFAYIEENTSNTTNGDGVPAHSIWVIVGGSGDASAIANAIYTKRNAGCGMLGSVSYNVVQADGSTFTVYWDTVSSENVYIKFTVTSLNGVTPPNIPAILAALPTTLQPGPAEQVNINDLATLVQQADNNTLVTNAGFSTSAGGSYTTTLSPSTKNLQFAVATSRIIITPIYISSPRTVLTVSGGTVMANLAISPSGTQTFVANGGYQVGVSTPWAKTTAGSAGSTLNTSTGAYVAGAAGTDVITYTDAQSNTAIVTIVVS